MTEKEKLLKSNKYLKCVKNLFDSTGESQDACDEILQKALFFEKDNEVLKHVGIKLND
jgi:hypothetical protein